MKKNNMDSWTLYYDLWQADIHTDQMGKVEQVNP